MQQMPSTATIPDAPVVPGMCVREQSDASFVASDGSGVMARHIHIHLHSPSRDEREGFEKVERSVAQDPKVRDPAAVAAAIGRRKYGAAGMARKAAAGRR